MKKETKEDKKQIEEKLKNIKLDLNKIPSIFEITQKVKYKPLKEYDNTTYKTYHFIDIRDIEIYITKTTRLEETEKKYKLAEPLICYLQPEKEEYIENYVEFLKMLNDLDINRLKELELQQKEFQTKLPFEIKYKENFIWEIYYSELENKYFMMFPSKETRSRRTILPNKKTNRTTKKQKARMYICTN